MVILAGVVAITSALAQKIMCPAPSPTDAASSTSSCVNGYPFQVAPTIESNPVSISIPIHLCSPWEGFVELKVFKVSKSPVTTILLPDLVIVTAS